MLGDSCHYFWGVSPDGNCEERVMPNALLTPSFPCNMFCSRSLPMPVSTGIDGPTHWTQLAPPINTIKL